MDGILRFADAEGRVRVGLCDDEEGALRAVTGVDSVADLLRSPLAELRERVLAASGQRPVGRLEDVAVLPPVDGDTEVWAGGVTYERSREARGEESDSADLYDRVYAAERPELFFKSVAWRVVTDGEPIAVRADSVLDVAEPELALVVNAHGEVVGYCVCDDVSSRSIEGENALYLPQAKVYAGGCALGPVIRPVWEVPDVRAERVRMRIDRGGESVFSGEVPLTAMRRDPAELVSYLFRCHPFPDGAVLATGTGIVPSMEFSLQAGDVVEIGISGVGSLRNPVVRGSQALDWLVEARRHPALRRRAEQTAG
ncbi:2-dehydro-3-deoxy-D-arabinonate dehydratase [Spinactinospora alkalitolerans]|uniref:2-dehydro-3-deoxy-D-arabinonate dehydratase n=1 Tax=Spinactinospora alkalitolerans TaxID=687207 RepID=A0A852TUZ6_9ACTN|nr:fumarylacetoacetate hydrolase family protein [Spinactinospora alkalitolerans]NYE47768.1 2-dehydro-3-deoxy-D-arabinonate dehydratase [Spinactinospora alkalitolerans]